MIYKIRVILDAEDDVFRDLELQAESSLEDFHNAIIQSFGFLGNEMASFYTCDEYWNQEEEIALFDMEETATPTRLMQSTRLEEVLTENRPKMIYLYDFMSMWTFFVELADIVDAEDGRSYPNVLFSFGELPDSPPEKSFEAEPGTSINFEEDLGNLEGLGFDENWN